MTSYGRHEKTGPEMREKGEANLKRAMLFTPDSCFVIILAQNFMGSFSSSDFQSIYITGHRRPWLSTN